ncbi:hypothetical protein FBY05_102619 [Pseudomonas sp. SJZ083]|uniref:Uncharacterized protein n=2 Tax=Pseudomonas fluorescens group TaxID=136843 RepID=A0ABY0VL96_9PSED|nr:hypothetical protein [Pseudomonas silensiensis]TWC26558.1 hypothetical protein FBY05_102619 [Pseudomonas sp. SJZ083]TWC52363.1 hypothetical protein FBY01_10225 [Pseudomonas sp. SJZ077]SDU38689.1 hypothetical protein SAMN04489801_2639 [Pseudomonas mandelii]VVP28778.1 hypothetical protein PS870_04209 [Pseudomonas fluorescens]
MDSQPAPIFFATCVPLPAVLLRKRIHRRAANQRARL